MPTLTAIPGSHTAEVSSLFSSLQPLRRIGHSGRVEVEVTAETYDPKADPLYDWVHRAALPAFQSLAQHRQIGLFCTVGTGAGCDALAAIEIFGPRLVALSDLGRDVVDHAARNVSRNLKPDQDLDILTGVGDLLSPFLDQNVEFDLVYENLPNLPFTPAAAARFVSSRNPASYHLGRQDEVPRIAARNLLELHWLCLSQARWLLRPRGSVLSSIGSRRPLQEILDALAFPEYETRIEIFSWKIQSEPLEVIGGFARRESSDRRFSFYAVDDLEAAFHGRTPRQAAEGAFQLEALLAPRALGAEEALDLVRAGQPVGHTVVVVASELT